MIFAETKRYIYCPLFHLLSEHTFVCRFKEAVSIINRIDEKKFPLLENRIIAQLSSQDKDKGVGIFHDCYFVCVNSGKTSRLSHVQARVFTEQEEEQLKSLLGLTQVNYFDDQTT